ERTPHQCNRAVQHAGGDMAMAPHRIQQGVVTEQFAAVLEQFGEYAKGLGLERDRLSVAVQFVPYGTQAEAVEVIALRTIHRRSIQVPCSVLPANASCARMAIA